MRLNALAACSLVTPFISRSIAITYVTDLDEISIGWRFGRMPSVPAAWSMQIRYVMFVTRLIRPCGEGYRQKVLAVFSVREQDISVVASRPWQTGFWVSRVRIAEYVLKLRAWSFYTFLLGFTCVAAAFVLRELFALAGATLYFATFFPAILVTSLFAGIPAALFAAVFSNFIVWWAFIPPRFSFGPLSATDLINFALFWCSAGLIMWVSYLYRTTLAELLLVEANRKLLLNELNHRLGNTFAVIQAIINGTVDSRELAERLSQRIDALARANALVTKTSIEAAFLAEIIRNEVGVFCSPDRLRLEGPDVRLVGETARSVCLIIHELATNAAKYGSLSKSDGALLVRWSEHEGFCELQWKEVGGPEAPAPAKSGFGTRLIRASLSAITGTLEPKFGGEGFSCVLRFSVRGP
jgi:two-component sensor histidine kinase